MKASLLILALESSAKPASVALYKSSGELLGQYFQNNEFSHSRTLLVLAESLMNNLSIKPSDIGLVAVSSGPGSFTGVRIGVSAAKGLAWGMDIPVCGVSTLEAMAYQTPVPGAIICPVMDARRNQVYNALFDWQNGSPVRLCEDRAISLEDLAHEYNRLNSPFILIGDGAVIAYEYLSDNTSKTKRMENHQRNTHNKYCQLVSGLLRYQTAYGVALAAMNSESMPASQLEPCYLRPSQAERQLAGASNDN